MNILIRKSEKRITESLPSLPVRYPTIIKKIVQQNDMTKRISNNEKEQQQESRHNSEILEYGDIYFFYRPKVGSPNVKSIDDIRRFFMVTVPERTTTKNDKEKTNRQLYRLFVIGKKPLPEIRTSEARSSERYWARVGGIFARSEDL